MRQSILSQILTPEARERRNLPLIDSLKNKASKTLESSRDRERPHPSRTAGQITKQAILAGTRCHAREPSQAGN